MKKIAAFAVLLCALAVPARAQVDVDANTKIVESVKQDLVARGVNLTGACGSFEITKRVAWKLRADGFKFLRKSGGNRAVIAANGSCLNGDESRDPGFATDYLIDSKHGFGGYDLLGDQGNLNKPGFDGPENHPDILTRNKASFGEPFDPDPILPPGVPAALAPLNQAGDVDSKTVTSVSFAASGAEVFDLSFGTTNPPNVFKTGITTGSANVGTLKSGTIYFWSVSARGPGGTTAGPVWSFATQIVSETPPVVEPPTTEPIPGKSDPWYIQLLGLIFGTIFGAFGGGR